MTITRRGKALGYRFWHHGQLYARSGFPTRRMAQEAEWARRREVGAMGPRHQRSGITFRAAVERYLTEVVVHQVNPGYKVSALQEMVTRWGDVPLERISSPDIREYRDGLKGRVSGATTNRCLAYLSGLFTWAEEAKLVKGTNPALAKHIKREPEPWRPWIVLTPAQEAQLWSLLPEHERRKAQLLRLLGVRRSVVLNLHWEQIDWQNRLAHYTSKGKSAVIPLNQAALEILWALGPQPSGRVFPETTDSTLRRWWAKARLSLGLPGLRRHDLRVAFARALASKNVDLKTIQALLGHTTPTMTLRYIPTNLDTMRAAVEEDADGSRTAQRPRRLPLPRDAGA